MSTRGSYHTKQKSLILQALADAGEHVTAEGIADRLKGRAGLATVYRQLEALVAEGFVIRYGTGGRGGACYMLKGDCCDNEHDRDVCHLLCAGCGKVSHIDCDVLSGLPEHIFAEHGVVVDLGATVLRGLCCACRGKSDK